MNVKNGQVIKKKDDYMEIRLINNFSYIAETPSGNEFLVSRCIGQVNGMIINAITKEAFIEAYKHWILPLIESDELK